MENLIEHAKKELGKIPNHVIEVAGIEIYFTPTPCVRNKKTQKTLNEFGINFFLSWNVAITPKFEVKIEGEEIQIQNEEKRIIINENNPHYVVWKKIE